MELIRIDQSNIFLINEFILAAGDSLNSFRYYNTRNLDVVNNHLVTYLFLENGKPVTYGHLDKENDTVWLGLAVISSHKGKGYGRKMLRELLGFARSADIRKIRLAVDKNNPVAISLYRSHNFVPVEAMEKTLVLEMEIR